MGFIWSLGCLWTLYSTTKVLTRYLCWVLWLNGGWHGTILRSKRCAPIFLFLTKSSISVIYFYISIKTNGYKNWHVDIFTEIVVILSVVLRMVCKAGEAVAIKMLLFYLNISQSINKNNWAWMCSVEPLTVLNVITRKNRI